MSTLTRPARHAGAWRQALEPRAPIRTLGLWLLLWPLWWILGIEQFVPTLVAVILLAQLVLSKQVAPSGRRTVLVAFALFMVAQLLSALGIGNLRRLLTFARAFATWAGAAAVLTIATTVPRGSEDVHRLIWILAGLVAVASAVAVAALLGFRPEGWVSPFARLLPETLERGGFLEQIAERSLGGVGYFRPLGRYYRVSSLFLWPLGNATAMAASLPLVATLTRRGKAWHRAAAGLIVLLGLVNLTFTTGRAAIAGLLAGGIVAWAAYSRFRRIFWRLALVVLAIVVVLVLVDVATPGGSFLIEGGSTILTEVVFARDRYEDAGSAVVRSETWEVTIRDWTKRPILGWGTARDMPGLALPAGTHSTYLGILYKHGLVGLLAYLALLLALWRGTRPQGAAAAKAAPWAQDLLIAGRWSMIAVLIDGLTSTPASDTMALLIIWIGFGTVLACRALAAPPALADDTLNESAWILGVRVASLSPEQLTRRVVQLAQGRAHAMVLNVNAHCLNLAYEQPWLRETLNRAELVFCDGAGVVLGARLLGQRIKRRITYAEWMWSLAAAASEAGLSMAFVGARPGIAALAADRLRERHPGLDVKALHDGYFCRDAADPENLAVIASINAIKPDILLVGFGMPLQERWLAENWHRMEAGVALTGGGVFDYVSGTRKRAPAWMTKHSLEWLGRLLIEPKRLWRRYLIGNPRFVWRILKQGVGIDRWPLPPSS